MARNQKRRTEPTESSRVARLLLIRGPVDRVRAAGPHQHHLQAPLQTHTHTHFHERPPGKNREESVNKSAKNKVEKKKEQGQNCDLSQVREEEYEKE